MPHRGLGKTLSTNCNLAKCSPLLNGQQTFLLVHLFVASVGSWSIMFEAHVPASILFCAWRNCAETERAGTMFTAFQFRRSLQEKKHPKIREASIFFVALYRKEGYVASWNRQKSVETKENHLLNPVVKECECGGVIGGVTRFVFLGVFAFQWNSISHQFQLCNHWLKDVEVIVSQINHITSTNGRN